MQGLIPQTFINELLTRVDIVDFIDSYHSLKKRGNSYIACCPFHSEKTPSFNVIARKQFYHCFGCGASGNVISFAMNFLQQSFPQAIETLAARCGLQVPHDENQEKTLKVRDLTQFLQRVCQFYCNALKKPGTLAIAYLKKRGISEKIANHFQIGYAPLGWHTLENEFKTHSADLIKTGMLIEKEDGKSYDRYRDRIMFPIHDRHGRIIGFGGRALNNETQPKYLNSPETPLFQKNRELYGLYHALQHSLLLTQMIIVEGYLDVITLAQYEIFNAVATLGTATSSYHIQLLSKHTQKLVFCFDGDNAGRKAAWRALKNSLPFLNSGLEACFIFLPEGHDPDSLVRQEGAENFLRRLEQATPAHHVFFTHVMQGIDHTSLSGRSQIMNMAKPYLVKMDEGPYKQQMINELARITHIDTHRINQLLVENKSIAPITPPKSYTRSPLRIAMALLIQHPQIYPDIANQINPEALNDDKHVLLKKILQQISTYPQITTGALVEAWRDTSSFEVINKLASWEHQVPENALTKELIDTIHFLSKQNRESTIQQLLIKARQHSLSTAEQQTLQQLLKERHLATVGE